MKNPTPTKDLVVIGPGSIGQAIARRVSAVMQVLLADLRQENADAAAKTLGEAGFTVTATQVDIASRASVQSLVKQATSLGEVIGVIHAAGVSPSQASPETILKVDLHGTAVVLEEFGHVIAPGGAGVVRGVCRGAGGHSRRGGNTRRTAHGCGRRVYHQQRLSHGRRRDGSLLVRRSHRASVTTFGCVMNSRAFRLPIRL